MKRNKLGLVLVVVVMGGLGYLRLPVAATPPRTEQFAVSRAGVTAGQPVDFSWGLSQNAAGQLLSTNTEVALEAPPYRTTPTL